MTAPSAWLRSLAAEATPGNWVAIQEEDREAYVWSHGAMRDVIVRPEPWEEGGVSDADARLIALAPDLAVLCADAIDALERIAGQQPKTLETLRSHGIVFDGPLGNDPKNWQHVAFSIYTDLCEVDTFARGALDGFAALQPDNTEEER